MSLNILFNRISEGVRLNRMFRLMCTCDRGVCTSLSSVRGALLALAELVFKEVARALRIAEYFSMAMMFFPCRIPRASESHWPGGCDRESPEHHGHAEIVGNSRRPGDLFEHQFCQGKQRSPFVRTAIPGTAGVTTMIMNAKGADGAGDCCPDQRAWCNVPGGTQDGKHMTMPF